MQCVRPNFSAARATTRSRISNRSRLLPGVDGRRATARRFRDICAAYELEAGGNVTEVERDLSTAAYRTMAAARLYADRPEITSKISWCALRALSTPSLPAAVRRKFEAMIMSGKKVMAPHIRHALQAHANRRPADQPARMAA